MSNFDLASSIVQSLEPIKELTTSKKAGLKKRNKKSRRSESFRFGSSDRDYFAYTSPDEQFGIQNWVEIPNFGAGLYGGNSDDFIRHAVAQYFKVFPTTVVGPAINVYSAIKILKNMGNLSGVYSSIFFGERTNLILTILELEGSKIFFLFDDIKYIRKSSLSERSSEASELVGERVCIGGFLALFIPGSTKPYEIFNDITKNCQVSFKEDDYHIDMIVANSTGLSLKTINLESYEPVDLNLHYGENFTEYHTKLLSRLESKDKGIVMLHGPPGTGKTHYIRNLIPQLAEMGKRVVLVPKHILSSLESPQFNSFMIDNFTDEKIVFIIEDAESIITKRESAGGYRSELVSTLLNITDGILNDIFNIQVVLTFNTEISSIDEALLRKGRLISKYEFENLPRAAADKLAKTLGFKLIGNSKSYSLAEIYALKDYEEDEVLINQNLSKTKVFVGF